jgi:hypothetical protein
MLEFTEGQLAIIRQTAFEVGAEIERRISRTMAECIRLHAAECRGPQDAADQAEQSMDDQLQAHVNTCPMRGKAVLGLMGIVGFFGAAVGGGVMAYAKIRGWF